MRAQELRPEHHLGKLDARAIGLQDWRRAGVRGCDYGHVGTGGREVEGPRHGLAGAGGYFEHQEGFFGVGVGFGGLELGFFMAQGDEILLFPNYTRSHYIIVIIKLAKHLNHIHINIFIHKIKKLYNLPWIPYS